MFVTKKALSRRTMLRGGAMELRGFVRWNEVQLRLIDRLNPSIKSSTHAQRVAGAPVLATVSVAPPVRSRART